MEEQCKVELVKVLIRCTHVEQCNVELVKVLIRCTHVEQGEI